jgi:hypothetical protein
VRAWKKLYPKQEEPNFIDLLLEGRKSCVYRLDGVGPGGTAIIAKRCKAGEARVEQTIYQDILPNLPISSLTFYGVVAEPGTEFRWFFVEDASGEQVTYSLEKHRRLAARWLAQMHVSAARLPEVSRLPDRGPQYYFEHLQSSRQIIQNNIVDRGLGYEDVRLLEEIIAQTCLLESHWSRIVELCHRYPRTLVHCDFGSQNLRVSSSTSDIKLVAFDWEMAGYGIPAPDIAEPSGRGVPRRRIRDDLPDPELLDYWAIVRRSWWDLDLPAIKDLAELGAVFRSLAAISWESECIGRGWWPIEELRGYQADLAVALRHLGLVQ